MKVYTIKNIDCENCAQKVADHIVKSMDVSQARINIVNEKLVLDKAVDLDQLAQVIAQVEDGVLVYEKNAHVHEEEVNDHILTKLIISGILFGLGLILSSSLLLIISYLIIGTGVIIKAVKNIAKGKFFDEFFLMSIATLAAILINELPEAVAVMLFYNVGEYIQSVSLARSRANLSALESMQVKDVTLVDGQVVKPSELNIGDEYQVLPGEVVCVDSLVTSDVAYFDMSSLTGETKPVKLKRSSEVLAGSIMLNEGNTLKVNKLLEDSTITKLIDLINYAAIKKTKSESFVTRFSKVYTPIVVGIALLIVVLSPLFGIEFNDAVYRAITILVVSCPCALVLSVPLGYVVAIGSLAKVNVLVKGSQAIDNLRKIKVFVTDKTGTLTNGEFEVVEFENLSTYDEAYLNPVVHALEVKQTHPIAKSIAKYTASQNPLDIESTYLEGVGVSGDYDGHKFIIKKYKSDKVLTSSGLYIDDELAAIYHLQDQIKPSSYELINKLKKANIKTIMLTGDNDQVASDVALKLGLDEFEAGLMPEDKLSFVQKYKSQEAPVMFVGDGINDAAVIKVSDVGVAMGISGSYIAIDNADMVISDDDMAKVDIAIKVSQKADAIIKQNIIFAIVVKLVFILLGIVGITTMWEAVFSDVGVTLIAILNSLRIKNYE